MNWFHYASVDVVLFMIFALIALVGLTILVFRLPRYLLDKSKGKEYEHGSSTRHSTEHEHRDPAGHTEPTHEERKPTYKEAVEKGLTHKEHHDEPLHREPVHEEPIHEGPKDKNI